MAMTAIQAVPESAVPYTNTSGSYPLASLKGSVDMISILGEYLGIPFLEFAATPNIDPADPWASTMTSLATEAKASGRPIMLQLALSRQNIVGIATSQNGSFQVQQGWAPSCADFSTTPYSALGDAYVNYVTWMAQQFRPSYLVVTMELNLYYDNCGGDTASWRALAAIEQRAYAAAKQQLPSAVVFPSFALASFYDQTLNGWDEGEYQAMSSLTRDRFGISVYPYGTPNAAGTGFIEPGDLPSDYLTRVRDRNPGEAPIAIAETGWNSQSISLTYEGGCVNDFVPFSQASERAYLDFVLESAGRGRFDVVTWWSSRDLIPTVVMSECIPVSDPPSYTECVGDVWCTTINSARTNQNAEWGPGWDELTYKAFGTMGIAAYDGTPKTEVMSDWMAELKLPRFTNVVRPQR